MDKIVFKKRIVPLIRIIRILFLGIFIFLVVNGKTMFWLGIYVVSLIIALLFGKKVYCNLMCPMNTVMIPTEKLSKKLNLQIDETPKWLRSGKFSWVALIGSIALMIFARKVLNKNIPILLIWLVASVIITLRYKADLFHNLICPFGPLQNLFSKYGFFAKKDNVKEPKAPLP